jgi:hypothetical protein
MANSLRTNCIRKGNPVVREEVPVAAAHRRKADPVDLEVRATTVRDRVVPDLLADLKDPGARAAPAVDQDPDDEAAAAVGPADLRRSRESSTMLCHSMPTVTVSSIAPS